MKRATLALLAVAGIALTGCSATTDAEPAPVETVYVTQTPEPVETAEATPNADAEDVTAAPVEVQPQPVETEKAPSYASPEDQFVAETNEVLASWGMQPLPAETALAGGEYLCEELASGATSDSAQAFGEVGAAVVHDISEIAERTIC